MSHFSFYVPSLPAAYCLFAHIMGNGETRHVLNRKGGEEWVDFIHFDRMATDQISIHLDPRCRKTEPAYNIEKIRDPELGLNELKKHLTGPSNTSATIGNVAAPMPHWGPVHTTQKFDQIMAKLKELGLDESKGIRSTLHHQGKPAEHKTTFLKLGDINFEIKGYKDEKAITAGMPEEEPVAAWRPDPALPSWRVHLSRAEKTAARAGGLVPA